MFAIDLDLIGVPAFVLDVLEDGSIRFAAVNQRRSASRPGFHRPP
jgi:hypothetical protein